MKGTQFVSFPSVARYTCCVLITAAILDYQNRGRLGRLVAAHYIL